VIGVVSVTGKCEIENTDTAMWWEGIGNEGALPSFLGSLTLVGL